MNQYIRPAIVMLATLTLLTGVVYPAAVTLVAKTVFPDQAAGSLIRRGEAVVGSELVGQSFTEPKYFWGRLSATAPVPYNASASSGSNYGSLNPALKDSAQARIEKLREGGAVDGPIPVDLVTASASGLDPHISLAAAGFQVPRVARARGMAEADMRALVQQCTNGRTLGVLGEPCVRVLELNLLLDQQGASPAAR